MKLSGEKEGTLIDRLLDWLAGWLGVESLGSDTHTHREREREVLYSQQESGLERNDGATERSSRTTTAIKGSHLAGRLWT